MSVTAQKMCQWPRWNLSASLWIFGGIPVAQAVPHVGVGFGVMRTVLGVDEPDSFELSFGIKVLAAVGQVVLGIAPQRENGQEHVRVLGRKRAAGELGFAEMIALSRSEAIQSGGDGVEARSGTAQLWNATKMRVQRAMK